MYSKKLSSGSFTRFAFMLFQFPSNGKVYSKVDVVGLQRHQAPKVFQFPSNGKVYSKQRVTFWLIAKWGAVSIPFKRESVFKDGKRISQTWRSARDSFNSLQTGKCIQRRTAIHALETVIIVSIPFKRESVFKVERVINACRCR